MDLRHWGNQFPLHQEANLEALSAVGSTYFGGASFAKKNKGSDHGRG